MQKKYEVNPKIQLTTICVEDTMIAQFDSWEDSQKLIQLLKKSCPWINPTLSLRLLPKIQNSKGNNHER